MTALGITQRLVLSYLADQGPIDCPDGKAVVDTARVLGLGGSHTSNLMKRLEELGLVERSVSGKRTYHLGITHLGRAAIDREASWHKRQRRSQTLKERLAVAPPAMPVGLTFTKMPVHLEAAREAAALAAVL